MSWFNNLATGFVHGLVGGILEGLSDRPAAAGHYDFGRLMHALAEATGVRLVNVREDRASFTFPFRGDTCFGSLALAGDTLIFTVYSKIEFRSHGVPHRVVQMVRSLNAELPRCDFELLDLDDCSVWCAQTAGKVQHLSATMFGSALTELAVCICRLDAWLVENGLAA
jgi:hypothetical protein